MFHESGNRLDFVSDRWKLPRRGRYCRHLLHRWRWWWSFVALVSVQYCQECEFRQPNRSSRVEHTVWYRSRVHDWDQFQQLEIIEGESEKIGWDKLWYGRKFRNSSDTFVTRIKSIKSSRLNWIIHASTILTACILIWTVLALLFSIAEKLFLDAFAITALEFSFRTDWLVCFENWLHFSRFWKRRNKNSEKIARKRH